MACYSPRRRRPIAQWLFHPDVVQAGLGASLCIIADLVLRLGNPPLPVGGDLATLVAVSLVVGPALLLCSRDYRRIGVAALACVATGLLPLCLAWLVTAVA
jgi:hypothetical protein